MQTELSRTESQVHKKAEVQDISGHLGEYSTRIFELKEQMSRSARVIRQDDVCLDQARKELESLRKSARNYGEDLLEDTLALDRLTGLFADDRSKRKEALARLDSLLEEADVLKADLASLDEELQVRVKNERSIEKDQSSKDDDSVESTDLASWSDGAMGIEDESPSDDPLVIDVHGKETTQGEKLHENILPEMESSCAIQTNADFDRTKLAQLRQISKRIDTRANSVQQLDDKIFRLVARMNRVGVNLDDEKRVLEDCEKTCRYLGEDVFDDTVALDSFSELLDEERQIRKEALVAAQTLHERLDKIKLSLASLKQKLLSELEKSLVHLATSRDVPNKKLKKRCNEDPQRRCEDGIDADTGLPLSMNPEVLAPTTQFWERFDLALQSRVIEEVDCYIVSFRLRNPQASNVKVQLNHDASELMVTGVQLPTNAESHEMQRSRAQKLLNLGNGSCDFHDAKSLYASLANGRFGRFSERIRLPRDVAAMRIHVSCDEGLLHVTLPKYVPPRVGHAYPFFR